jgi:hypothetical protein
MSSGIKWGGIASVMSAALLIPSAAALCPDVREVEPAVTQPAVG